MANQAELHNRIAGPIAASIITPVIEAGGNNIDVMVLTETVVAGVCMVIVKLGGDETVVDTLCAGVKQRLAEARLKGIETAGGA